MNTPTALDASAAPVSARDSELAPPAHRQQEDARRAAAQVDAHSVRAREAERARLRADIEAFLAAGGKVQKVAADVRSDLPRAPQNSYGKGSL